MLEHMNEHLINVPQGWARVYNQNAVYELPQRVIEKYRVKEALIPADTLFADLDQRYTKPGALLRGLRVREQLTQKEMAKRIGVTQANISQMEKGLRPIGRTIAKRIEKKFDVHYRLFLA